MTSWCTSAGGGGGAECCPAAGGGGGAECWNAPEVVVELNVALLQEVVVELNVAMLQEVVAELNRLGLLVDLGGSSLATAEAALTISQAPVVFSNALTSHRCPVRAPAAVTDAVLHKLVRKWWAAVEGQVSSRKNRGRWGVWQEHYWIIRNIIRLSHIEYKLYLVYMYVLYVWMFVHVYQVITSTCAVLVGYASNLIQIKFMTFLLFGIPEFLSKQLRLLRAEAQIPFLSLIILMRLIKFCDLFICYELLIN